MRFSRLNQLVLSLMIFGIQHLRILVLYSGKVYFLLKLRCFCGCYCRVVWVLRDFLPTEKLLVMMMLVVLFVIWKLRPLITFLFIALLLRGSRIFLCNGLGMLNTIQLFLQEWNHLLHGLISCWRSRIFSKHEKKLFIYESLRFDLVLNINQLKILWKFNS